MPALGQLARAEMGAGLKHVYAACVDGLRFRDHFFKLAAQIVACSWC